MKNTFKEVINFLDKQSAYMLIGSFALNLHQKFPYSDDLDINLNNIHRIENWTEYFLNKKWKLVNNGFLKRDNKSKQPPTMTLLKNGTTLDFIYDPVTYKKFKIVSKKIGSKKIRVIELNGMLIRKLSVAFRHPERGEKRSWDLRGAITLFKKADKKRLLELFKKYYL
jgi:hypothetical protein